MASNTFKEDSRGRQYIKKDPAADLDYSWDWSRWLNGADIALFRVTAKGCTIEQFSMTGDVVTAQVSGGRIGVEAWIRCEIVTYSTPTAPQKAESRTLYLQITTR
jgi:hypothetical protein